MEQLLSHLKGQPANEALTDTAEAILKKTSRYRSSVCRLGKKDRRDRMTCGLTRSRIIRYIRVEGLPPSFLETDFRKRIFLKEGELIDQQEVSGKNRITRQRKRLEVLIHRRLFKRQSSSIDAARSRESCCRCFGPHQRQTLCTSS